MIEAGTVTLRLVVQYAVDAVSVGSLYAMYALGIALIFGVMGLINFAYGELIMVTGYVLVLVVGPPVPVVIVLAIGAGVLLALLMERIAFRPIRGADATTLLVTSFAVSYLLQNLAALAFSSTPKSRDFLPGLAGAVHLAGISVPRLSLVTVGVAAALVGGLVTFLKRTTLGLKMRAAAEDFEMCRLLGVNANQVIGVAFAGSGLLAAAAGVLFVAQTGTVTPTVGVTPLVYAFIATIIGGIGSLVGAVLGGLSLGAAQVVFGVVLPQSLQSYRDAFVFAVVLGILVVRPSGLIVPAAQLKRV
jgi:branched-chain amino acid transport system permease protein